MIINELIININFFILVLILRHFLEILTIIRTVSIILSDIRNLKRHRIRHQIILLASLSISIVVSSIGYHFESWVIRFASQIRVLLIGILIFLFFI